MRPTLWLAAALTAIALVGCGQDQSAEIARPIPGQAMAENQVPGAGVSTPVQARTGSMSSGTRNSDTVAGAPAPGTTNPATAH